MRAVPAKTSFRLAGVSSLAIAVSQMFGVTPLIGAAHAADPAPGPGSSGPEQIVVSASKRLTKLQKTPISITAITGAELQKRGIASVTALARDVPGVAIKTSGPGQTEFEIRGLSSAGGSSPTVGFYLDDTPLTAPAAAQNGKVVIDPNLYDLSRIEVLRGPQGTLYGSGSEGGTIRVLTNQPNLAGYQASAQTTLSGTDGGGFNHGENIMVNLPLIPDVLSLRIVGSEAYTSGWIDRIVAGNFPVATDDGLVRGNVLASPVLADHHDVNDEEQQGFRAALLYKPNDQLTITPFIFFQQIHANGLSDFDSHPGTFAHYEPFDIAEPFADRFFIAGITANYKFDAFDVTSSTSHWNRGASITEDESEQLQYAFGLPSAYVAQGGVGPAAITENDYTRQWSEEIRVTSSSDSAFQWLVGGFYSNFDSDYDLVSIVPGAVPLFGTSDLIEQTQPTHITQYAGFGDLSYQITPQLKADVGLRYYAYTTTVNTAISGIVSSTGSAAVANTVGSESNAGVNPKFNLSYQATNDIMVYGTAAKGFRPGGANQPVPVDTSNAVGAECLAALEALGKTTAPAQYGPDSVWSYEVGEKATLFDRLTVNGAIYYEDWHGVQQVIPLSCGFPYTDNAGNAAVYGGELEVRAKLAQGLVLSGTAARTDAYLTENVRETGAHKGDPLQDIAPWTASAALSYNFPVTDSLDMTLRGNYEFQGTRIDATYYPMNHLPAYSLVNLRAELAGGAWVAALFANNVTNKKAYLTDTTSLSLNLPTFNRVATNQPLTIGIDLSYRFR
jgi:outer membrane receptor protein involved in Fe transport